MPYVTVGKENSANIELYYEDHGSGTAGRVDPWISIKRRLLGKAGSGAAGCGLQSHHLRPPRVRQVQPADRGLQL